MKTPSLRDLTQAGGLAARTGVDMSIIHWTREERAVAVSLGPDEVQRRIAQLPPHADNAALTVIRAEIAARNNGTGTS